MSVLIKGMEMPTSCDDCEFCERDISGYDWCCIPMVNGRAKPLDEPVIKPDWCPLVPVPPHGKLIDADALIDGLTESADDVFDGMATILNLEAAPTIIEAEGGE